MFRRSRNKDTQYEFNNNPSPNKQQQSLQRIVQTDNQRYFQITQIRVRDLANLAEALINQSRFSHPDSINELLKIAEDALTAARNYTFPLNRDDADILYTSCTNCHLQPATAPHTTTPRV